MSKAVVPIKMINSIQMKERRDKGLCYYCDSKWNPGHKCRNPKLFLIEEVEGEDLEETENPKQVGIVEEKDEELHTLGETLILEISLHALKGSSNPRTMRVKGKVAGQWVVTLVDSGSIHNFLDSYVARRAKLPIGGEERVKVRIANGD